MALALAIELAAGRVQTYGLRKTAELLDEHLTLHWPGRRTAPPRQRTLQATLDWSYELLTDTERTRHCGGSPCSSDSSRFEAALQVATERKPSTKEQVFRALESLDREVAGVRQSAGRDDALSAARHHALVRVADRSARRRDARLAAERHAIYFRRWLEQIGREWPRLVSAAERAPHMAALR